MISMAAIQVEELTKYWNQTKAVDNINFQVNHGEVFGFLGPNGAGKTTTIKMLVGLTRPTSGSATVAGYDVASEIREVKKRIGVVPESSNLYDELTINQNLRFVSKLYHIQSSQREKRIKELLETFQLSEYSERRFAKLSKGLKRRTVLAAALLHEPEILFMDEPTAGLDVMSARNLRQVISEFSERGVTIFLTTHYIEEAGLLSDRIALLVKGRIIEVDSPEALRGRVQDSLILRIRVENKQSLCLDDLDFISADSISMSQGEVSIFTSDIQGALYNFMEIAADKHIIIRDVQTVKPNLEDAFIQLTGLSLESMRMEKEGKR
jgi:ABC-2 type transport system ATP-binding protein